MIEYEDQLSTGEREFADQLNRYLAMHGVGEDRYWIGPAAKAPAAGEFEIVASYERERDENGNTRTQLHLPFRLVMPPLVTGFSKATSYMIYLLAEPGALETIRSIDVDQEDEALLEALGIDWNEVCRPSVKAWTEGSFLAPDDAGYAYFLVEPYGSLTTLGTSEALAPVAWAFMADEKQQQINLAGRVGRAAPIAQ